MSETENEWEQKLDNGLFSFGMCLSAWGSHIKRKVRHSKSGHQVVNICHHLH